MTSGWQRSFAARERAFEALTADARRLCSRGDDVQAAFAVQLAAEYAWRCPFGRLSSPELESILQRLAGRMCPARPGDDDAAGGGVLHVASRALSVGGHTRIVREWVKADAARTHDLALTDQRGEPVPANLARAIASTGGTVHDLAGSKLNARAQALRRLAAGHRFCVVHQDPSDVVPSLALTTVPRAWSTVLVDHADHVFWLGTGMADVVAHLRPAAARLAARHRGLCESETTIVPLPMGRPPDRADRWSARERLGIGPDEVLVLSIASEYKFGHATSAHFLDPLEPLLARHEQLRVLIVGPEPLGRWQLAADRRGGRVQAVGPKADVSAYLSAADIYIDSFPFPSFTSVMQAAQLGLPALGRRAAHPDLAYLQLDDVVGGSAVTWVGDDAQLAATVERWVEDPTSRYRAGAAAAEAVRRLPGAEEWLGSIGRTYALASRRGDLVTRSDALAEPLPARLAEALAEAHHQGRIDGAFFHALVRDRRGGDARVRARTALRTAWRTRGDRASQRALFALWRDRVARRFGRG
jgi:hypothetical protein